MENAEGEASTLQPLLWCVSVCKKNSKKTQTQTNMQTKHT